MMRIEEICSLSPVHIPHTCTLRDAAVQMRDRHVGALVVTEPFGGGQRAMGIVTDRDIVLESTAAGTVPGEATVADVMTRGVVAIGKDAGIDDALQTMLAHGVRRLAVTDAEAVVGVLSLDDIVDALGAQWNMLASVLHNERERERSGSVQTPLHA
ncbi:cyclic nucleotide-binding/CBS domain-containing protein [Cupriavidus sp. UME77]|uniref:CBS domain-containing protein n=1 Tax=Cupriavidus sp. UME77 TaxID=1862321 RepID=UPI00351C4EBF